MRVRYEYSCVIRSIFYLIYMNYIQRFYFKPFLAIIINKRWKSHALHVMR